MVRANVSPFSGYTDESLLDLWHQALELDEVMHSSMGHIIGYTENTSLREFDMYMLRAGLKAHAKLCKEHGIPVPENLSYDIEEDVWDEEIGYETIYEYESAGNDIFENFTNLHGIGDFEEADIVDVREIVKGNGCIDGFPLTRRMVEEVSAVYKKREEGNFDVLQATFINSGKLGKIVSLIEVSKLMKKEIIPKEMKDFFESFIAHLKIRNCWDSVVDESAVIGGHLCVVNIAGYDIEEGVYVTPLYRNLSMRIGAYIAQELAERVIARYIINEEVA